MACGCILQSSHLLMICSSELPFLVLGLLFFEGGYILLYCGTPTFWQRGLWDSWFQNPSESSDLGMAKCRVPFLGHCDLDL